ncbi:CocE/NonD family hydrolase [Streptomyces sp. NPDC048179]|uniref:CocE/NonD family hydrolase n=1 Tax=Streptomyces sp. NPDC048179 TaxID=3365506 RepID=UPI003724A478
MSDDDFTRIMKAGTHPAETGYLSPSYREVTTDGMLIRYDQPVPMRDGVEILADLFLPEGQETDVPVVIGWGAYGKQRVPGEYAPGAGVRPEWVSRHCVFEAPDPAYWTRHGYAVAYVNPRGTWYTDGTGRGHLNKNEAEDIHDLVEWLGTRDWSNGRVGMTGVSYYAIVQWFAAATRPPHLAAINPWEGFSDRYRETVYHGGIVEDGLNGLWWNGETKYSLRETEDGLAMMREHPLFDAYWAENKADLAAIEVPAYVVASWSDHGLHTRGTLEGYKQIGSTQKWLDVHGQKKWEYQYRPENVERLRVFFDHFLKGEDNELRSWPPVRLEVRDRVHHGTWRDEREWPLARTRYTPLYLDATTGGLQPRPVAGEGRVAYDSTAADGRAEFVHTFAETTELTGHMKLRLWVEAPDADDLDLFVVVDKLDAAGERVTFAFFSVFTDGPVALGWLRASHRELDPDLSTDHQPVHLHTREQKLAPGEIVPVDIEIWPSSTRFLAGESIRVTVQGHDTFDYPDDVVIMTHTQLVNAGRHVIHSGGRYDSHLLMPVVPTD